MRNDTNSFYILQVLDFHVSEDSKESAKDLGESLMGDEKIKNNQKDEETNKENDRRAKRFDAWIGFVGVIVGAIIGFVGNWHTSKIQLEIVEKQYQQELEVVEKQYQQELEVVEKQHQQEIELMNREKTEEIYTDMLQSIYGLRKIYEGLVDKDILDFREECYTIMAKARIFCKGDTVDLYDEFLDNFFESHIYNGEFVDNKLIPAIRAELNIKD